jgi:hypothetical protein
MYHVMWEIDIEGSDDCQSSMEAARAAWDLIREPGSIASVFTVTNPKGVRYVVDLYMGTSERIPQANTRLSYPPE